MPVRTVETFGTFRKAIGGADPEIRRISMALRELVSIACPDVVEVPWTRLRVVGYGIGPKKSTEHFCYIAPFRSHVNFGFNRGAKLPDPDALLEGGGKGFRHVKIQSLGDVRKPALKRLLKSAIEERRRALESPASGRR